MEWCNQYNELLEKLQTGWMQSVQAVQSGNFDMVSMDSIIIMAVSVMMNLAILTVLIKMRLLEPILKFMIFVLIFGIIRLVIMALRESMRV